MRTHRPAVTLTETLIVAAVLALLLIVTALGVAKVRSDLKHKQVRQLLVRLDEALSAYHQAAGQWPTCPATQKAPEIADHGHATAQWVIAAMSAEAKSRAILQKIPAILLATESSPGAKADLPGGVVDAWGRPIRCLTADSRSHIDREAVAGNGGKPIFISAGADGAFGIKKIVAAADNLRSDELPR